MPLLELTADEVAFLTAPAGAPDGLQPQLTCKLGAMLSARLHLPLRLTAHPVPAPADTPPRPVWQPDAALATLWLTRRLGGKRVSGTTTFVPPSLIHALEAALAECWLDGAVQATLPAALGWHITTDLIQARLAVALPHHTFDMTRWARGVIGHG